MTETMTRPDEVRSPDRVVGETARSALLRPDSDRQVQADSDPNGPPRRWRRWPS
ncbi:MAG TPA: hypothetical protein VGM14_27660 [Streptosporangiaceae bacterium]